MGLLNTFEVEVRGTVQVEASSAAAALRDVNDSTQTLHDDCGRDIETRAVRAVQTTEYR